jgi:hypothetical protein
MPGYGIVGAGDGGGLLPWSWAEERLSASHNYWLSTSGPDGKPHAMPLWAVWSNRRLLFSTGEQSRKYRNLVHEPRCTLTTEHGEEAVVVEGRAVRATDPPTIAELVAATKAKYDYDMSAMNEPVFVLQPERVFGFVEAGEQFIQTATRWTFPT